MPLRPIVSNNQAPLYNLSKYLSKILQNITYKNKYYIKNSFDFKKFIDKTKIPHDHILISLDVKSLYTNIPIDVAIQIIKEKWPLITTHTDIPEDKFIDMIELTLTSGYFQYNNNYYKQIEGVAMGSPISSVIAQIVMEQLETQTINKLDNKISLYKRYVDDCILAISPKDKNVILNTFNSFHPKLQFTIELENKNQIDFLDMTLIRQFNTILTKWHTKQSSTDRHLNYQSEHHITQKISHNNINRQSN